MDKLKKICIFLFSGTGMTKFVIDKLKNEFETEKINVDIHFIENTKIEFFEFNNYDIVGIAYPVHSLNAPKIVINFARKLPTCKDVNTFIISTVGEKVIVNNSSSKFLYKILRKKGFNVYYENQFEMPSNFIVKDDENKFKNKITKINEEIKNVAVDITNFVSKVQQTNIFTDIMAIIGRIEWIGLKMGVKIFYANENCILCGKCIENCPNKNIFEKEKRVIFKRNCGLCMRCCTAHAELALFKASI